MKKEMICIICPMGCHLQVDNIDGDCVVQGNACPRGANYAKQEAICPMRTLTSTVRIANAIHPLLPVITSAPVPKQKLFVIMEAVNRVQAEAPIKAGSVVAHNIANCGVDLLASRTMEKIHGNKQSAGDPGHPGS